MYSTTDTYYFEFSTYLDGAPTDADSLPTGDLFAGGTDTTVNATITDVGTGLYTGSVSLSGRSIGDVCYVRISATVDGTVYNGVAGPFRVTSASNVTHMAGTSQTARDIGASVLISSGTGTGQLDVTSGVITAIANNMRGTDGANTTTPPTAAAIADAVFDEATSGHVSAGTFGKLFADVLEDTNTTIPGTVQSVGADVSDVAGDVDAVQTTVNSILVDTNELQTNQGNWLTATGFSTHSAADVWTVSTRTLSSFGTLVSDVATAVWSAVTRTLTAGGGGTGLTQQEVADALKLAPSAGSPASGSVNADLDTLISRTAAGVIVNTSGTTTTAGNMTTPIRRGDAYNTAAGNEFTVSSNGFPAAVWDDTVTGTLKILNAGTWTETGSVAVTHDGDETITGTIALTSAQTAALTAKAAGTKYEVEFSIGTDQRTIGGTWVIQDSDES